MDGRTWTVYEFHMPSRFEDDFPAENGWNVRVRHDDSENDYRLESTENEIGISTDEDGSEWLKFGIDSYGDVSYIQVEQEVMRLAVGWTPEEPVKISYSYSVDSVFFGFEWTVFVVWPCAPLPQLSGAELPINQNSRTALWCPAVLQPCSSSHPYRTCWMMACHGFEPIRRRLSLVKDGCSVKP